MKESCDESATRQQVVNGLKWSALGKSISQVLSWVVTLVVIRLLAPGDYGLMAVATVLIAFIAAVNEFGLGAALVQAKVIDEERIRAVFGAMLFASTVLAVSLALAAPVFAAFFNEPRLAPVLGVAGLQFILSALVTVPEALMRRSLDFKRLAAIDIVATLAASCATLALALAGSGVWSLVFGTLAGATARAFCLQLAAPNKIWPSLRMRDCKGLLTFGGNLTASRLLWQFLSQADVLIGAKMLGKDALGLYSVSLHLASLPMQKTMGIINQVIFSAAARNQDNLDRTRQGLAEGLPLLLHLVLPVLYGLAAVAPEFVQVVLGPQWAGGALPLQIVALAIPLRMVSAICSTTAIGLGHASIDFRNTLTGAIIMPICFLVGAHWGADGLASGWLVGVPVVFALNFRRLSPLLGIGWKDLARFSANPIAASVLMIIAITLFRQAYGHLTPVLLLFLLVFLGITSYVFSILLIDRAMRQKILRKWHPAHKP